MKPFNYPFVSRVTQTGTSNPEPLIRDQMLGVHVDRRWPDAGMVGQGKPRHYMRRYFGPEPPSRGVQRGPTTSVALQSTQFGAFTRRVSPSRSYTPAGQMWE